MATRKTPKARAKAAQAEPWDKDNPKKEGEHQHLTPQAKASAKRHAKAAGRPYPNLVDNMRAAAASKPAKPGTSGKSAKPGKAGKAGST